MRSLIPKQIFHYNVLENTQGCGHQTRPRVSKIISVAGITKSALKVGNSKNYFVSQFQH